MKTIILVASACLIPWVMAEEEEASCCKAEAEVGVEAEGSVYQLDAKWTDQHGKPRKLSDLKGSPVLVTMGYASCEYACPRLVADLLMIEKELTKEEKKDLFVVFVSIDPERDTPEKLTAFFKQHDLDQKRWIGLRGDDDAVLELSVALGTRYRKLENNDFAHSNRITLLSAEGEIVYTQEGLGTDPAETVAAIRGLSDASEEVE